MTVREALGSGVQDIHERLDGVLDNEDAIIVLMDRQAPRLTVTVSARPAANSSCSRTKSTPLFGRWSMVPERRPPGV